MHFIQQVFSLGLLFTANTEQFLSTNIFWVASLSGFIIFLPNLIWQYQNQFTIIFHMRELAGNAIAAYISPAGFLSDQLLINFPCFFIWLTGLFYTLFSKCNTAKHIGLFSVHICDHIVVDRAGQELLRCRGLSLHCLL